jgi:hypothetical protein
MELSYKCRVFISAGFTHETGGSSCPLKEAVGLSLYDGK